MPRLAALFLLATGRADTRSMPEHGVCLRRGAFTADECDSIVALLKQQRAEKDHRPDESISRTNYWEKSDARIADGDGVSCPYEWIYDRVVEHVRDEDEDGDAAVVWGCKVTDAPALSRHLDFVLMHEFRGSDFFDWHVDTTPGDRTGRTVNINVMLSDPDEYGGGGLRVGDLEVRPRRGDLYWYPAAFPHRVDDVESGLRHTLVLAVRVDDDAREGSGYWEAAALNFERLCGRERVEAGAEPAPSKWHLLHGEHLVALGREAEADLKFADAYAATEQAAAYAEHFDGEGQRLVAAGQLREALPFFRMAARIEPSSEMYAQHLAAVEDATASR